MAPGARRPAAAGIKTSVIVCDNHPAFALGLAELLKKFRDIDVVGVATSGEQAAQLAADAQPDVAVLEIRMLATGAEEAARAVRRTSPNTKVLILTASNEPNDLLHALRAGVSAYVSKNVEVAEVVDTIRLVMSGQVIIPAHFATLLLDNVNGPVMLTDEQHQILMAISRGETNKEIATRMSLGERTVKRKVEAIYAKLHLTDRLQAAMYIANQDISRDQDAEKPKNPP